MADDHPLVREGIKSIFTVGGKGIIITDEYSNGKELLKDFPRKRADVYILNISMPKLNGIETAARIIKSDATAKIIILSMYDNKHLVEKALKAGAKGYVLKENSADEIVLAVKKVYDGGCFFSGQIKEIIDRRVLDKKRGKKKSKRSLTVRENEILDLIAEGFSNKEISVKLKITLNTVRTHRKTIMSKLNIHKQTSLVRYAIKAEIPEV